jgi:hypothetical protein
MQGHRYQNLVVIPYNLEIECTIRQSRRPKEDSEEEEEFEVEEKMAEAHVENQPERKPMKSSLIPQNLNQPLCIAFQLAVQSNYNLSPHLLNIVLH